MPPTPNPSPPAVELERACVEGVEGVLEAAAVACPPPGGGPDQLHLFLVLRPGAAAGLPPGQLRARCQAAISAKLNPLFKVGRAQDSALACCASPGCMHFVHS